MNQKLIPFYVKAHQNRMGYSLFIDMETMKIFRAYNDNYRFFASTRYWIYVYAIYWTLSQLTNIMVDLPRIWWMFLLIASGIAVYAYAYGPFYKQKLR